MAVTGKVMIESFVTRKAALAVGTLEAGNVYISALVLFEVCRSVECLVMLRTVTVVGCLLVTQTIDQQLEHLSADWTSIVLVGVVLIACVLTWKSRPADADSTLARAGGWYCEVKEPVRLAFVGVGDIAFMVLEGILAFNDRAAAALEEMTE